MKVRSSCPPRSSASNSMPTPSSTDAIIAALTEEELEGSSDRDSGDVAEVAMASSGAVGAALPFLKEARPLGPFAVGGPAMAPLIAPPVAPPTRRG